ncbi:MAG: PspC domain-containing protein [Methanobacteriota archaeon]
MATEKRFRRSRSDRVLGGVAAGLAHYLGIDVLLVRVGLVLVALVTAIVPMVVAYLLLWILAPEEPLSTPPTSSLAMNK